MLGGAATPVYIMPDGSPAQAGAARPVVLYTQDTLPAGMEAFAGGALPVVIVRNATTGLETDTGRPTMAGQPAPCLVVRDDNHPWLAPDTRYPAIQGGTGMPVAVLADYGNYNIFQWDLRDDFAVPDEGAPIVTPNAATPGPGQRVVRVDTGPNVSITAQRLRWAASAGNSDPVVLWTDNAGAGLARRVGWALVHRLAAPAAITALVSLGWSNVAAGALNTQPAGYYFVAGGALAVLYNVGFANVAVGTWNLTDCDAVLIARASGQFYVVRGGGYADWRLMYITNAGADATLWPSSVAVAASAQVRQWNSVRAADLPGNGYPVWLADGIAAFHVAAPGAGATQTGFADGTDEITWTAQAGETLDIRVRRTDGNNHWSIRCAEAGAANPNTIKIFEVQAGVPVERNSAAQAFAAGNTYRVLVRHEGQNILTFVNNAARNTYALAAFNQNVAGCEVTGFAAAANWYAWPWAITGLAGEALDRLVA